MNIVINYDFYEAIKNVKEPMNSYKIARNNKHWIYEFVPLWTGVNMFIYNQDIISSLILSSIDYMFLMGITMTIAKTTETDIYKMRSDKNLKNLVNQLNELNINTTYDLLLDSKLYEKKHKVQIDENKLPCLVENKYILVPTHSFFSDEIKDVSIEQEHVLGSHEYVLSLGKPKREHSYSYAFSQN